MARGKGLSPTRRHKRDTGTKAPKIDVAGFFQWYLSQPYEPGCSPVRVRYADYRRFAGID